MEDHLSILKKYWGFEDYRPLQKEIIESVLSGRDTLAILPTGGGKSICFQVPALVKEGICLVVSPLIALMKDQVENLKKRGIPALLIHSGMQRADVMQTLRNATDSYFRFLYISPERLETGLFREFLPAMQVSLIAVDEAHCISQWGHDFRPAYRRLESLRKELPDVPVLAVTASATPEVQLDITEQLRMKTPSLFRLPYERKNLSYSAFRTDAKAVKLAEVLQKVPGSAIVYCKSRKRTTEIARLLEGQGIPAAYYHAGLKPEERNQRQEAWVRNKTRVIVCTNAFGMGIDKPDVRAVIHMDPPECLENYYQEAGRAGRDGLKSYAVLLFDQRDRDELAQLHQVRYPGLEQIRKIYQALVNFLQIPVNTGQDKSFVFRFDEFIRNFKMNGQEALYAIKALEQDGWLDYNERNFSPSTIVFTTNKKGLYEFQQSYPHHEALLTTLLRTYGGIFDFPSFIVETTLARLLKKEETEIRMQLKTIASFGILHYIPRNDEPQLVFRKNRVAAEDLTFNLMQYYKRRDAFVKRTGRMLEFIGLESCRSQFISRYFGDQTALPCQVCDNCLKARKTELTPQEFEQLSLAILKQVAGQSCTIETLLTSLQPVKKEKAWKVLEFLQAENKIRVDRNRNLVLS
ncbi:MAG TPA: ATP-dependent DNA helicase RecQ [Flavisolibacter sp.]|jgi:ATP-dependent DNA helicase RecQ|nr:ATP-dependent DNA helicase RecQ [Flavisolibacter sp.]